MRGQLAGESACIRRTGTVFTIIGQRFYKFSGINLFGSPETSGVLNVRSVQYAVASGLKWVTPRPWEWFELYSLNNPVPDSGPPSSWTQHQQGSPGGGVTNSGAGAIIGGDIFIDPPPDIVYTLQLDCACYPSALAVDTDPEAIPYEWTDAIPYGAAWMALLSAQTSARMADAERYLNYFKMYVQRARDASNPDVLKYQYEKQINITLPNQVGIQPGKGG